MDVSVNNAAEYLKYNHLVQKEVFTKLISQLDVEPGFRCLDIGCGTGNFTKLFADLVGKDGYVLGIDPDQDRIELARKTYSGVKNLEFICVSGADTPTNLQQFDIAFSCFVLHWMKNEEKWKTFQNVFSLLKPSGKFIFRSLLTQPKVTKDVYSLVEDKTKVAHIMDMEYPILDEYKQKLVQCMFKVAEIRSTEHISVFQTHDQLLACMNSQLKCDIDIFKLYDKHKEDIQFERNENGEYLGKFNMIDALAEKPKQQL